mmetsp:Transcript_43881/g.80181  ORF Transcript_43881/g.80181 Transcript_43881/m.80181 type:complete len:383 (+) Transcript_43881:86-1234(+)
MGLSDDILVAPESISQTLRCPICLDVFVEPVFCGGRPCQHVFCKSCILDALSSTPQCPACREPASAGQFQAHQAIGSLLDEIMVYCRHKSRGCSWTGRLDAQSGHSSTCAVGRLDELERKNAEYRHRYRAAEAELAEKTALTQRLQRQLTEQREKVDLEKGMLQSVQDRTASLESLLEQQRMQAVRHEQTIARLQHSVQDLEFQLVQKDATIMRLESRLSLTSSTAAAVTESSAAEEHPVVMSEAPSPITLYSGSRAPDVPMDAVNSVAVAAPFPTEAADSAAPSVPSAIFHFTASGGSAAVGRSTTANHTLVQESPPSTGDEFTWFLGPAAATEEEDENRRIVSWTKNGTECNAQPTQGVQTAGRRLVKAKRQARRGRGAA